MEFVYLLHKIFEINKKPPDIEEQSKIEALEVQHYQTLIHRNFNQLFKGKLRYYDPERQNDKYGKFDTQEVGEMDFLAIDEKGDLVVIELKRNSTP